MAWCGLVCSGLRKPAMPKVVLVGTAGPECVDVSAPSRPKTACYFMVEAHFPPPVLACGPLCVALELKGPLARG